MTTSQGVYYIDRTFEELAELNTVVCELLLSFRCVGGDTRLAADRHVRSCDVLLFFRCQLKDLPTLKKMKSVRGVLKKPNKPKSMVPFQPVLCSVVVKAQRVCQLNPTRVGQGPP